MEIRTNAENRKDVVKALSERFGERAVYLGPPSFAYQIGSITVGRDATVAFDNEELEDEIRSTLREYDFSEDTETETQNTTVRIPLQGMDAGYIINLINMLHARQYLINRAFGRNGFSISDSLTEDLGKAGLETAEDAVGFIVSRGESCEGIAFIDGCIVFTGFTYSTDAQAVRACCELASAMVKQAGEQKRVSAKPVIEENEKYYMRSWLVRLGLGGKESKDTRNFLLKNLKGHTAFRTPEDEQKWKAARKAAKEGREDVCSE